MEHTPQKTPGFMGITLDQSKSREEILAMLAKISNEYMAELGYTPDILERLQVAESSNEALRAQNEQLFNDRRMLSAALVERDTLVGDLKTMLNNAGTRYKLDINMLSATLNDSRNELARLQRHIAELTGRISMQTTLHPNQGTVMSGQRDSSSSSHRPAQMLAQTLPTFAPYGHHGGPPGPPRLPPYTTASHQLRMPSNPVTSTSANMSIANSQRNRINNSTNSQASTSSMPFAGNNIIDLTGNDDESNVPLTTLGKRRRAEVEDVQMSDATPTAVAVANPNLRDDDGLFPIDVCVGITFRDHNNEQGAKVCIMCEQRYARYSDDMIPTVFRNPRVEELVKHCEEEHPLGWNILRTNGPSTSVDDDDD